VPIEKSVMSKAVGDFILHLDKIVAEEVCMFPHVRDLHLTLIVLRYILRFASLLRTSPHSFIPVPAWPLRILLNNTVLDRCSDE
jgi:hypothetical protein